MVHDIGRSGRAARVAGFSARRRGLAALLRTGVGLAMLLSLCGAARAQSGVQLSRDGKRTMVSKDVGGARWAIARNPDGTVTGNVFFPGGGPPQFIWCQELSHEEGNVRLSCYGADLCPLAECDVDEWLFLTEVTLPESFFSVEGAGETAAAELLAVPVGRAARASSAKPAGATENRPSGLQISRDGGLRLISKDVGVERWAISRNEDGTVTGNVFLPEGGDPKFVWCEPTSATPDPVELSCYGAPPCQRGACHPEDWQFISAVSLPASFFAPRDRVPIDTLAEALTGLLGADAAFDAVALAIDRGYSLRQVARAALSGRLQASGKIVKHAGGIEAPAGSAGGLFRSPPSATAGAAAPAADLPNDPKLKQLGDQTNLTANEQQIIAVLLIVALVDRGYDLNQVLAVLAGGGRVTLSDGLVPTLVDERGNTVEPEKPNAGVTDPPKNQPRCGNGTIEAGEDCDSENIGSRTCLGIGFTGGGNLSCLGDCHLDVRDCRRAGTTCGNGAIEPGETCDGLNLNGKSCTDLRYSGGMLACSGICEYYTAGCVSDAVCGDGKRELPEECDRDYQPESCSAYSEGYYDTGEIQCSASCRRDFRACRYSGAAICGNERRDGSEECDGSFIGGETCSSIDRGFAGGDLRCGPDCRYDTSGCIVSLCGNGRIDSGEQCDDTAFLTSSCAEYRPGIYESGTLRCTSACKIDESNCRTGALCGNGVREGVEQCDGTQFGGNSCFSLGFESGTLACTNVCTFDTSGCRAEPCPGRQECEGTCIPAGADCCEGEGGAYCNPGSVCVGDLSCCPANFPKRCGDACIPNNAQCCGGGPCPACGNGAREGAEQCDGADLGGATCGGLGYGGGTLACSSSCTFDTSGCNSGGCPGSQKGCEGTCIPAAGDCCVGGGGAYCPGGSVCVGDGGCCPSNQPVRCGGGCISEGTVCCGSVGCGPGNYCDTEYDQCCPEGHEYCPGHGCVPFGHCG